MASPRLPRKRKAAAAAAAVDAAAWTSSLSSSDTGEDEPPAKKQRKRPAKEQKGEEEATKEPKVQNKTAAATPSPAALGASQPDDGQNLRLMMWRSPTEDVTNGWLAIKCWRELWLAITTLVESHVVDKVKWATLDAATKEKLTSWAPKAKEYLPHAHLSASIFEGWIWRVLVDGVFKGHDNERWDGYGAMVNKLEHLATVTPDLLAEHQNPHASGVHWKYPGWQVEACDLFKRWYHQWRSIAAILSRFAAGPPGRFDHAYVEGLITGELGPFLRADPGGGNDLRTALGDVAELTVRTDRLFQCTPAKWEFHFTDPETDKPFGFKFNGTRRVAGRPVMELYLSQSPNVDFCAGLPVDHVVRPHVRSYKDSDPGDGITPQFGQPLYMEPMTVYTDMFGPEAEEHHAELDRKQAEAQAAWDAAEAAKAAKAAKPAKAGKGRKGGSGKRKRS